MKPVAALRLSPRLAAILVLAVSTVSAGSAMAQARGQSDRDERGGRSDQDRRTDHRALAAAVRRVERATGGEVLSAERVQSDGRDVSRVKVVDASGRVRVYMGDSPPRERRDPRTRGEDSNRD